MDSEEFLKAIRAFGPGNWFNRSQLKKSLNLDNYYHIEKHLKTLDPVLETRPGKGRSLEYRWSNWDQVTVIMEQTPIRPGPHRNGSSAEGNQVNATILIEQYGHHWPGRVPLEEELEHHEAWFMRTRLPWLCFDSFYHLGVNRQGNRKSSMGNHERGFNGWDLESSGYEDRETFLTTTKEDLLSS